MSATPQNACARDRTIAVRRSLPAPAGRSDGHSAPPDEQCRAWRHPISRWYVCPAADRLAAFLEPTRVRPVHLTLCGLAFGSLAAAMLLWRAELAPVAAVFVLTAWFFDRADGRLARRQDTVSAWGAWLDANVDELLDVGLHVAVAATAASQSASSGPWLLLIAFLAGKYLFMHGLAEEDRLAGPCGAGVSPAIWVGQARCLHHNRRVADHHAASPRVGMGGRRTYSPAAPRRESIPLRRLLRRMYHLPGNADVRVHLLAAAMSSGWFCTELFIVAAYYNLRWIARYALVARRLGGRG